LFCGAIGSIDGVFAPVARLFPAKSRWGSADDRKEKISKIIFSLEGEDGIVHRWVRKFQDEFAATVVEIG